MRLPCECICGHSMEGSRYCAQVPVGRRSLRSVAHGQPAIRMERMPEPVSSTVRGVVALNILLSNRRA